MAIVGFRLRDGRQEEGRLSPLSSGPLAFWRTSFALFIIHIGL